MILDKIWGRPRTQFLMSNATGIAMDVTEPGSVAAAFEQAGPVDILVNNSGIAEAVPFHHTSLELWNKLIAVNLTGVFLCTQAALGEMYKRNSGRIINISSTAGLKGFAFAPAYCMTKHGVIGLTRSLALGLASTGITANCVCPGFTRTEMASAAVQNVVEKTGLTADAALAEMVKTNPQNRLIEPEEIAEAVLWLCSDLSSSVTGQAIAVAGGEVM